jgi:hypothetical protein
VAAWIHLARPPASVILASEPLPITENRFITPPPAPDVPQPLPPDIAPAPVAPARGSAQTADADTTLRDELFIMERASADYSRGRYTDALAHVHRHETLYPNGILSASREKLKRDIHQKLRENGGGS